MEDLYNKVKDLMAKKEFDNEIQKKINEFNGLIDTESAALIILDEKGRIERKYNKISSVNIGEYVNVKARIKEISVIRKFTRKNGSIGEVVNIELSDGSGIINLVLWDQDTELIKVGKLKKNSIVKILNGNIKQGKYKIEINISKGGTIIIE